MSQFISGNREHNKKQARTIAFRLFKWRPRSEHELRTRLKEKECPPNIAEDTITYFKQLALLDDRAFAREWVTQRLRKPLGFLRIRQELFSKGIAKNIIDETCRDGGQEYDEREAVATLAQRQARCYRRFDTQTAQRRLYGYLLRRGFSPSTVRSVLRTPREDMA